MNKDIIDIETPEQLASEVTQWATKTIKYMETREYKPAVQAYEDIQLYMGRRLLENTKAGFGWSSNEKYPLISNAWRTYSGMMSRLDLNKVIVSSYMPNADEKVKKGIPVYKNLVKFLLNKPESKRASTQIIDEALITGTSYARISWEKKKTSIVKSIIGGSKSKKQVTYDTVEWGYPVIRYASYFDVVRDLSNQNRYIGERYYSTKIKLKEEYGISDEKFKEIDKSKSIFSYDYNKVKNISIWDSEVRAACAECIGEQYKNGNWVALANKLPKHDSWYDLTKNGLYEVFDVFIDNGDSTHNVVMVNGIVVFDGKSELPFPGAPIIQLNFETMPGEIFGKGIGWMGRGYQSSVDTLYNSYLNSIKILTNPHFTQEETLTGNNSNKFNYIPWGITPTSSGVSTLERLELVKGEDTRNNLEAIQIIEAKFSADLGLNPYVTGEKGGIERSAEGVRQKKSGTDNKISKFLDNINEFFSNAIEKMALMQIVFGDDVFEEIDGNDIKFTNKDILLGYKVTFDGEAVLGEKSARTQEAINLLSSIAPFNIDQVTQEQIVDSKTLLRRVFENLDMYDMVKGDKEREEELIKSVEYMKKKSEIMSQLSGPTDPFDKQNLSISITGKDLLDIPEARQKILSSIGIEVTTSQAIPQQTEQGATQTSQTPDIVQPDIGRELQLV